MLRKIVTNRIKKSFSWSVCVVVSLCGTMCISLISVRPAESVYRPVRPAERMCTGRCDPLRKCVQAGAARRENVYRPVRPAERMCTGWWGPLRELMCTGRCSPLRELMCTGRCSPLRVCTGRCGPSLSDCGTGRCGTENGPAVQDFSTDVAGKAEFYFYH